MTIKKAIQDKRWVQSVFKAKMNRN